MLTSVFTGPVKSYLLITTDGTGFISEDICGGDGLQEFCDEVSDHVVLPAYLLTI